MNTKLERLVLGRKYNCISHQALNIPQRTKAFFLQETLQNCYYPKVTRKSHFGVNFWNLNRKILRKTSILTYHSFLLQSIAEIWRL